MKGLDLITLILIIIGGLNMGIAGLFGFNIIDSIFAGAPVISRIIWVIIGLAALYQIMPLMRQVQASPSM
jgi:uncharacterized membrane protein YuzA (DUF378 family)